MLRQVHILTSMFNMVRRSFCYQGSQKYCAVVMLLVILTVRKLSEHFMSTENGQVIIIALTFGLIRKI